MRRECPGEEAVTERGAGELREGPMGNLMLYISSKAEAHATGTVEAVDIRGLWEK